MEIDFEGLYNATQDGKKRKIEENNKLNENVKKECAELKKIFINIINNDVKREFYRGTSDICINQAFENTPALRNKSKNLNSKYLDKIINLSNLCDEFNYKSLIEPIEKKINIKFIDDSPYLIFGLSSNSYPTVFGIKIQNNNVKI